MSVAQDLLQFNSDKMKTGKLLSSTKPDCEKFIRNSQEIRFVSCWIYLTRKFVTCKYARQTCNDVRKSSAKANTSGIPSCFSESSGALGKVFYFHAKWKLEQSSENWKLAWRMNSLRLKLKSLCIHTSRKVQERSAVNSEILRVPRRE